MRAAPFKSARRASEPFFASTLITTKCVDESIHVDCVGDRAEMGFPHSRASPSLFGGASSAHALSDTRSGYESTRDDPSDA